MTQLISLAYSPDTDDAFMVYALKNGLIEHRGYRFEFHSEDIQQLNQKALGEEFDITAISMALYPSIMDRYALMPVGASVGDRFGPAVVVPESSDIDRIEQLEGRKVAVPGLHTSAYYASLTLLPFFQAIPLAFDQIAQAVREKEVDAGILIHELQIDCKSLGFRRLGDLGSLWDRRFGLPLPLGANAIRRSLGETTMRELNHLYLRSVQWALDHRSEAIAHASASATIHLSPELANRYIEMYVNDRSLDFAADVSTSLELMFSQAAQHGLCAPVSKDAITADLRMLQDYA